MCRRTSRTASSCRGRRGDADDRISAMPPGSHMARLRGSRRCSIATAKKRALSAARCAMPCCALAVDEIDVATTAVPEEVMRRVEAAGCKAVPTGIEHGTVTVVIDHQPVEVTTLRQDVETFGRKARVVFGRDWRTDAERRDFTINALSASADGNGLRLCRRHRRHCGASRALHRRAAAADRRRLSAHPAVLSLPRAFRQRPAGPGRPARLHRGARRPRDAVARARAHGIAEAVSSPRARRRRSR